VGVEEDVEKELVELDEVGGSFTGVAHSFKY
jgi:hypothetical protein